MVKTSLHLTSIMKLRLLLLFLVALASQNSFAQVQAALTVKDVSCFGGSDGSISVTPFGGWDPYTYQWSNGANTQTISGLPAGNYTVTVTDKDLGFVVVTGTVNQPSELGTILESTGACGNAPSGTINAVTFNGTPPYSWKWSNGATTQLITGLTPGTYSVTVTDANGCTHTNSTSVGSSGGLTLFTTASYETCTGSKDAHATVIVQSGGNGPFTYQWSNGANTQIANNLGAGTYTVTVTDNVTGCSAVATQVVELSPEGLWIMVVTTPTTCAAPNSGTAEAKVMTGVAPYTYIWSNGGTTQLITGLAPGTYRVTVTDANGCTNTEAGVVDASGGSFTLNPSSTSIGCNKGYNLGITPVGATNPVTYSWSTNGGTLSSTNTATTTFTGPAGDYVVTVVVTDASGCAASYTFLLNIGQQLAVNVTGQNAVCASSVNLTASSSNASGTVTYAWSTTGGTLASTSGSTNQLTGAPGSYTVTVVGTDANGCTASKSTTVNISGQLSVVINQQNNPCNPTAALTASASNGTGTISYSWTSSGGSLSSTTGQSVTLSGAAGTYNVTVTATDGAGCTNTSSTVVVLSNSSVDATAVVTSSYLDGVEISKLGGNDGSARADATGGTSPYTYAWSNGATTKEITGLSAGTYTVTVTDNKGCTDVATVVLKDPAKLGDYTWLDENGNGQQDAGEKPQPGVLVRLTGTTAGGKSVNRSLNTDINGMYMFDGLAPGTYKVTFNDLGSQQRTQANTGNDATDSDADPITGMTGNYTLTNGEYNKTVDAGYLPCKGIKGYIWYDKNKNGRREPSEDLGLPVGGSIMLMDLGPDRIPYTSDDIVAATSSIGAPYRFECVTYDIPYYIMITLPATTTLSWTIQDAGGDDLDSDIDQITGKSGLVYVLAGEPEPCVDGGLIDICEPLTNPGRVGFDQTICEGTIPALFQNLELPSGGNPAYPIEYVWMYTETNPFTTTTPNWLPLPNSDSPQYQATSPLTKTTWFIRCARRQGCNEYIEPRAIQITVRECPGIRVNPNLSINLGVQPFVQVEWAVTDDQNDVEYFVERSADNNNFVSVGTVYGTSANGLTYHKFNDMNPVHGRMWYRIRATYPGGSIQSGSSSIVFLKNDAAKLSIWPNPARSQITIESYGALSSDAVVEIFDAMGKLVLTQNMSAAQERMEIPVNQLTQGNYVVRITTKDGEVHRMRLSRSE